MARSFTNCAADALAARCALLSLASACAMSTAAHAACEWSFNWYCSGCAKIGARTTGTNGGFGNRQSCEAARANMQRTMDSRGGGVNTVACQSSGSCSAAPVANTPPGASGERSGQPGFQPVPPADDGAEEQRRADEARRKEAARREEEARIEREREARVRRDRDDALNQMKSGLPAAASLKGGTEGLALKGLPSAQPVSKFPAWQQLNCLAGALDQVVSEMDKASPSREVIHSAAQRLGGAQMWDGGQPMCAETPDPPKPYGEKSLSGAPMMRFYENVTRAAARDADLLDRTLQARYETTPQIDAKAAAIAFGYLPKSARRAERLRASVGPSLPRPDLIDDEILFAGVDPRTAKPSPAMWTRLVAAANGVWSADEMRSRATRPPDGLAKHRSDLIPGTGAPSDGDEAMRKLRAKRMAAEEAARARYVERLATEILRIDTTRARTFDQGFVTTMREAEREQNAAFVAAMKTATMEMKQAIAALEKSGMLLPGDDVRRRMRHDPEVRRAVLSAQAIVVAKENAAFERAQERFLEKFGQWGDSDKRRRDTEVGAVAERIAAEEAASVERQWDAFFADYVAAAKQDRPGGPGGSRAAQLTDLLRKHRASIGQVLADPTRASAVAAQVK